MIALFLALAVVLPAVQDGDIEKFIRQLTQGSAETRRKAEEGLMKAGWTAVPTLERAARTSDQVILDRVQEILVKIRQTPRPKPPPPAPPEIEPAKGALLSKRPSGLVPGASKEGDAALRALDWLARHQGRDGSWSDVGSSLRCDESAPCPSIGGMPDYHAGITSLALLAFGAAGYTSASTDKEGFGDVVRKGHRYLMSLQQKDGGIAAGEMQGMYHHALATRALVESLALDPTREELRDAVRRAVAFLLDARNPGKGWRYQPKAGDNDSSVTTWCALTLLEARDAGVAIPQDAIDGANAWFDEATAKDNGAVGYNRVGTGKVFMPGKNDHFNFHPSVTAGALLVRLLSGKKLIAREQAAAVTLVLADAPSSQPEDQDYYYVHMATTALCQSEGGKGERWKAWSEKVSRILLAGQQDGGCAKGSWIPADRWSFAGGRIYATAINAMTLMAPTMYSR